jgi:hypothetical protein
LNGARVPFKELGFSSIEELLNSTGNFTIQNRRGVKIVQILSNKKTQHLTELISKQKSKPPKKNPVSDTSIIFFLFIYDIKQNVITK